MRITTLLLALAVSVVTLGQKPLEAPFMNELRLQKNGAEPTYQEIISAGNAYFETIDKDAKGSGYKPFMRWIETAKQFVKPDGTLQTNVELNAIVTNARISKGVTLDNSNWFPKGPFSVLGTTSWSTGQGRVNSITVDPSNPNTYYIGTPGGGLWKSTDAGINWTPLTDFFSRIGASALAVDPNNSNVLYVGTGDDDGGDTPSIGMLKSNDGGATWSTTGLIFNGSGDNISEIYINPLNSNELFISTSDGFYKSLDAGTTVSRTFIGNVRDIKLKPGAPNTIYLATPTNLYLSTNSGNNFTQITAGVPAGIGRFVIAVTPANASYVYALAALSNGNFAGVYRSTDSGVSFIKMDSGTDILESPQAFYDLALEVSATNANEIYTGCLNVWKSTNGGASFLKLNNWSSPNDGAYTHADIHQIRAFGNSLFVASDGGIYRSVTNGSSFTDLTATAAIGQFYRVAVSKQSSNSLVGGLQDNGGQSFSTNQWKNYYGADGMDTAIDPNNSDKRYGFIQRGGNLYRTDNGGNTIAASFSGPQTGNWITPLQINNQGIIYAGYQSLYRLDGAAFTAISTPFSGTIDVLKIDPTNDNIIYVGVNGSLYRSTNAGTSFTAIASFPTGINAIEVNKNNNSIVYVSTAFTSGGVFKSTDSGQSFIDITGNLPALSKNTLAHFEGSADNDLFLGTSVGVYRYTDSSGNWELFNINLPNVSIRDLEVNPNDNILTAATYGRGIWQTAIVPILPTADVKLVSLGQSGAPITCGNAAGGINVTVKNTGVNAISTVLLSYSVDGGAATTQPFQVNLASGAETDLSITNINLPPGQRTIDVTSTTPNDAFISNNKATTTILKNDSGVVNTVYGFETTGFLTANEGGGTSVWERGTPAGALLGVAGSGVNAYATNLDGNYPDETIAYLYSGCYSLGGVTNPVLSFDMAFDLEQDWDILYLQVSTDSGVSWQTVGTSSSPNWYNSSRNPNGTNCFNCIGAQWTGTDAVMKQYSIDVSFLRRFQSAIFRFVLHTDQSVTNEGAVVDNFVVTATLSNDSDTLDSLFTVYPNPSTGMFTMDWSTGDVINYGVYDMAGKLILTKENISTSGHNVNLTGVAKGVYLLKINTTTGTTTKKLIVQ